MIRFTPIAALLFGLVTSNLLAGDPKPETRPITQADSVLAVYTLHHGLGVVKPAGLIFSAWPDGHVVWSDDRVNGGAPYKSGKIEPKKIAALLSRFEDDGLFANKKLNEPHFGPDSSFVTVLVKSGRGQVKMESWHELYEAGGKVVGTKGGLVPLAGRNRLAALAKEPTEYLHYRLAWSELRESASRLIPSESNPVAGKLLMEEGNLSWEEGAGKAGSAGLDKK